jgi:midasin
MDVDAPEGEDEAVTEPKEEEMPVEEVELNVLDLARPAEGSSGEDRWRYYTSLTSDLSYALCEQLRLILQPTLATRLQGDFRTGKRLNMRKIIPYIASEFSKDRIWMRRVKPSKRQYQILLCVDNSRSMAENRTVDLAFQALALVAQALTKLEVGQIGIASFGSSVDILHDFSDVGFTDAHGAAVMNSFSFDQQKTDVAALVERSLSYLAEARQSQTSAAPDLWQVTFIVSDGVCQDHAKLSTLLRRALEDRVFIVFIIIDQLQAQPNAPPGAATTGASNNTRPSILSLQTVEYKNVGGEMKLEMSRYLDTFPFQYYVVLRDVTALPGVLSDILRQWAVRVAESAE